MSAAISSPPDVEKTPAVFSVSAISTVAAPVSNRRYPPKRASVTKYVKGVSPHWKGQIRRQFEDRLKSADLWTGEHPMSQLNDAKRVILERVIFELVDDYESQGNGRCRHPQVPATPWTKTFSPPG
jgi:hypothetical protein